MSALVALAVSIGLRGAVAGKTALRHDRQDIVLEGGDCGVKKRQGKSQKAKVKSQKCGA